MNNERCINCASYNGVEGVSECSTLTYSWALSQGLAPKNPFGLSYVPVRFEKEGHDKEIFGFLCVSVMGGDNCPHFVKAEDNYFCEKCGKRLVSVFASYCHNCGHPIQWLDDEEEEYSDD